MYKVQAVFTGVKLFLPCEIKSKSGKNNIFWPKQPICGGVEGK